MEVPVRLGAVPARPDAPLHRRPLLQNVGELLRGGPAAGQGGAAGLEHGAQLKQIPQLSPDLFQAGEAEVADLLHLGGDKGASAPAHLQHPPVRQGLRLRQDLLQGTAAVAAPELGDDAEGAPVVAALGNPQVGVPGGRSGHPVKLIHRGVDVPEAAGPLPGHGRLNGGDDVLVATGAQNAVHLGQLPGDLLPVALRHAAGDQDLLELSRLLQLRHAENVLDGLLAGAGEKAAGVDHRHVGPLRRIGENIAGIPAQGHHLLAVDHVLGAAQGNEMDRIRHGGHLVVVLWISGGYPAAGG